MVFMSIYMYIRIHLYVKYLHISMYSIFITSIHKNTKGRYPQPGAFWLDERSKETRLSNSDVSSDSRKKPRLHRGESSAQWHKRDIPRVLPVTASVSLQGVTFLLSPVKYLRAFEYFYSNPPLRHCNGCSKWRLRASHSVPSVPSDKSSIRYNTDFSWLGFIGWLSLTCFVSLKWRTLTWCERKLFCVFSGCLFAIDGCSSISHIVCNVLGSLSDWNGAPDNCRPQTRVRPRGTNDHLFGFLTVAINGAADSRFSNGSLLSECVWVKIRPPAGLACTSCRSASAGRGGAATGWDQVWQVARTGGGSQTHLGNHRGRCVCVRACVQLPMWTLVKLRGRGLFWFWVESCDVRETLPLTCSLDFGYANLHSWKQGTVLSLIGRFCAILHFEGSFRWLWQSVGALMAVWLDQLRDLWDSN